MDAGGVVARSGIVGGLLGAVGGGPAAAAAGFVSMGTGPGLRGGRFAAVAPLRVGVAVGRRRTPTRPAPFVVCAGASGGPGGDGGARGAASGGRRRVKVDSQSNQHQPHAGETSDEPKRASTIVQALNKAMDYLARSVTWRSALGLILFLACTILGYYGAKGNQKAKFAIDVLDKTNKAYKPALECATLITKFALSFINRSS